MPTRRSIRVEVVAPRLGVGPASGIGAGVGPGSGCGVGAGFAGCPVLSDSAVALRLGYW